MIVVGAGVIGTEYASMFAALGVDVHVEGPRRAVALLKSGKRIVADLLLYSIGRIGATAELDLAAAGLAADDRGRLTVNAEYQTLQPHIYAAGDIIGFPALASTSLEQGRLAACHAFGIACTSVPHLYPIGISSIPELSMVGRTEEELTKDGVPYEVGVAHYREIARGAILGDETGILKLIVHRESRQLLGVHILGTAATELVHIGQAFLTFQGRSTSSSRLSSITRRSRSATKWQRSTPITSWGPKSRLDARQNYAVSVVAGHGRFPSENDFYIRKRESIKN